jgi:sugar lactone lactonase YvrE
MCLKRATLLTTACLAIAAVAHAESPPNFLLMWGSYGTGSDKFFDLRSVAAEPTGNVLVVDHFNGLRRFTSAGTFVQVLAMTGNGNLLEDPFDIAVAPTGEIYVVGQVGALVTNQVVKLSSGGTVLMIWGGDGSGPGQFQLPGGIATDAAGQVYVADTGNRRIQVFDSGGHFQTQWATRDPANYAPEDLVVAGGVAYVVSETGNAARVEKYTTSGSFLGEWPITLPGESSSGAFGIAIDAAGALYVGDDWNARVKKFAADGTLLSSWDGTGNPSGGFISPTKLDVDLQGSIFICDYSRIQKYGYGPTPVRVTTWGKLKAAYR